ncbi:LysR family transcriptional regulator [Labrys sp. La1]|uniref:LysR family transcriptional regulator n=1 Tax=Labrys sp. La1 TaxID=3404917 RepID=UPI003EB7E61C
MSELLNLNRLAFFTAVIETGSFTAAGERLGVAKAVVSHQVGRLEEELGVTLILRTTRRLQATEAGRAFYDRAALILREAESAFGEISKDAAEPTGVLTLAAQIDYGGAVVAPAVAAFRQRYPHMRVEVAFDDTVVDLVDGQVDVAVRVGWLTDSSNQAQRLGTFQQHLVCSAALAAGLPGDLDPKGLAALPFVANHALRTPGRWLFSRGEWERETVEVSAVVDADKTPTAYAMVLAGGGLSVFPDFLVAGDIAAGRLVRLLADWTLPAGGIHVVYPAARFRPAKVRLFVEILKGLERARSKP